MTICKILLILDVIWIGILIFSLYMVTGDMWQLVISVFALVLQLGYLFKNRTKKGENVVNNENNIAD